MLPWRKQEIEKRRRHNQDENEDCNVSFCAIQRCFRSSFVREHNKIILWWFFVALTRERMLQFGSSREMRKTVDEN